jgi:hypothetical protein
MREQTTWSKTVFRSLGAAHPQAVEGPSCEQPARAEHARREQARRQRHGVAAKAASVAHEEPGETPLSFGQDVFNETPLIVACSLSVVAILGDEKKRVFTDKPEWSFAISLCRFSFFGGLCSLLGLKVLII